jgi:hypothetical protein
VPKTPLVKEGMGWHNPQRMDALFAIVGKVFDRTDSTRVRSVSLTLFFIRAVPIGTAPIQLHSRISDCDTISERARAVGLKGSRTPSNSFYDLMEARCQRFGHV